MVRVAGVDGCRAGWVVAIVSVGPPSVRVVPAFAAVVELLDDEVDVVAVDMPIGLPEGGARACDVEARRRLGPRRASVFPAPPRPLLGCTDHARANAAKRALDGSGLSRQAFNLLPRIAEVDAAVTPAVQERVVEAHPELAFARLAGHPLTTTKRTADGRAERRRLLGSLGDATDRPPAGAAEHDLLDALALTLTAGRLLAGTAERLGDGARDARGLRMEIAW